jgi:hypothetical protein
MLKVDVALPKNKWKDLLDLIARLGFFHPEEYKGETRRFWMIKRRN